MSYMEQIKTASELLGMAIKQIIIERDTNQTDLAEASGIPRNSMNRKLNFGTFTYDELTRIAAALDVLLSSIIQRAEALADKEESK